MQFDDAIEDLRVAAPGHVYKLAFCRLLDGQSMVL